MLEGEGLIHLLIALSSVIPKKYAYLFENAWFSFWPVLSKTSRSPNNCRIIFFTEKYGSVRWWNLPAETFLMILSSSAPKEGGGVRKFFTFALKLIPKSLHTFYFCNDVSKFETQTPKNASYCLKYHFFKIRPPPLPSEIQV